jgi:hypothetical protein
MKVLLVKKIQFDEENLKLNVEGLKWKFSRFN